MWWQKWMREEPTLNWVETAIAVILGGAIGLAMLTGIDWYKHIGYDCVMNGSVRICVDTEGCKFNGKEWVCAHPDED